MGRAMREIYGREKGPEMTGADLLPFRPTTEEEQGNEVTMDK